VGEATNATGLPTAARRSTQRFGDLTFGISLVQLRPVKSKRENLYFYVGIISPVTTSIMIVLWCYASYVWHINVLICCLNSCSWFALCVVSIPCLVLVQVSEDRD
jgi:hypothetical protein